MRTRDRKYRRATWEPDTVAVAVVEVALKEAFMSGYEAGNGTGDNDPEHMEDAWRAYNNEICRL